jgi:hypothetical protein
MNKNDTSLPLPTAKGRRRAHSQTTSHPKPFHKKSREDKQKPMARRGKRQKNIQKELQKRGQSKLDERLHLPFK